MHIHIEPALGGHVQRARQANHANIIIIMIIILIMIINININVIIIIIICIIIIITSRSEGRRSVATSSALVASSSTAKRGLLSCIISCNIT